MDHRQTKLFWFGGRNMRLVAILLILISLSISVWAQETAYPDFYDTSSHWVAPGVTRYEQQPSSASLGSLKLVIGGRVFQRESNQVAPPAINQMSGTVIPSSLTLAGYTSAQTAGYPAKPIAVQPMQTVGVPSISAPVLPALPTLNAGMQIDVADRFSKLQIVSEVFSIDFFPGEPIFVAWEGSRMLELGISCYFSMAGIAGSVSVPDMPKTYVDGDIGLADKLASLNGNIDPCWPLIQIPGTPLRAGLTLGPLVEIIEYQDVGLEHLQPAKSSGPLITYFVTIIAPDDNILGRYVMTWSGSQPMLLILPANTPIAYM